MKYFKKALNEKDSETKLKMKGNFKRAAFYQMGRAYEDLEMFKNRISECLDDCLKPEPYSFMMIDVERELRSVWNDRLILKIQFYLKKIILCKKNDRKY